MLLGLIIIAGFAYPDDLLIWLRCDLGAFIRGGRFRLFIDLQAVMGCPAKN